MTRPDYRWSSRASAGVPRQVSRAGCCLSVRDGAVDLALARRALRDVCDPQLVRCRSCELPLHQIAGGGGIRHPRASAPRCGRSARRDAAAAPPCCSPPARRGRVPARRTPAARRSCQVSPVNLARQVRAPGVAHAAVRRRPSAAGIVAGAGPPRGARPPCASAGRLAARASASGGRARS